MLSLVDEREQFEAQHGNFGLHFAQKGQLNDLRRLAASLFLSALPLGHGKHSCQIEQGALVSHESSRLLFMLVLHQPVEARSQTIDQSHKAVYDHVHLALLTVLLMVGTRLPQHLVKSIQCLQAITRLRSEWLTRL